MAASIQPTATRDIQVPIGKVFDYVSDCLNDPEWCPLVESSEQLEGEGPGVGSVYRWQQVIGEGQVVPMDVTVEVIDRPHRLEWSVSNAMFSYSSEMSFESLGDSVTRVSQINRTTVMPAPPEAAAELEAQAIDVMNQQMTNLEKVLA